MHDFFRMGVTVIDILLAIQVIDDADEREYIGKLYEKYSKKVKRLALNIQC